jgi:phage terminase large subunit-like protein
MSFEFDYVGIATAYAKEAVADKKRKKFNLFMRQAAQRFLDDLKRAKKKDCNFIFDSWHACDACDFIEKLPHVEGNWETPNIILHESHVFFIVQLFGFRKKESVIINGWGEDGVFYPRRFTSAFFVIARKNAKSLLASSILNYCNCCEPEIGPQILSAATTYDQASIVFKAAKAQVEKTADLREAFGLEVFAKTITRFKTGSVFHAIHAKASTQDGLNPSVVSLDEVHAHKNADLINVLQSAAGARNNPLFLFTTTEGYVNAGPWQEYKQFLKKLLAGIFGNEADHVLVSYYSIDEENKSLKIKADDEFNEATWIKANPLMEVNPLLLEAIRKDALEAKTMPSKLSEFRIKRVNRPASTSGGWVDLTKWEKGKTEINLEWLEPYPCWGGLDLASVMDLASFRLVWLVEGIFYTYGFRFCPEDQVTFRAERGTVPYESWVNQGLIIATPGNTIDYSVIETCIEEASQRFKIQSIGFDPWNASDIVSRLVDYGLNFVEFIQGPRSYHPAMRALEQAYISGKFKHGGDPVLTWCASNLIARTDVNLNTAPDRKRSTDKIDDMAALLMAIGVSQTSEDDLENYEGFIECPIIGK